MLNVKGLTFSYRKHGVKVLDGVSFAAKAGSMTALLGANGAGKSTLFRCLLGFEKEYGGTIRLGGRDIRELSRKQMAELAAYVPQSEMPVFNYTVFDSVLMGTTGTIPAFSSPGEEQIETAWEAIRAMGIDYLSERGVAEISGGERQLTMLARALAQKARLLIMDEPTANLDYGNQQVVLKNIRKMTQEGFTVLFSTHNPEHALQYASDVLVIKDHRILAAGPCEETLSEELIEQVYGLSTKIVQIPMGGSMVKSCVPIPDPSDIKEGERE